MDGILLIDKPSGWTSHDVVAKVRVILRQQANSSKLIANSQDKKLSAISHQLSTLSPKVKVGHTGTLDPMATGLLILVVGNYTKRAAEFSKLDKVYEAELTLGAVSTTGDKEGEVTSKSDKEPSLRQIEKLLSQLTGKIQQTPHAYSAIKVEGKRAYDISRKGGEVKLGSREVTIYEITDMKYDYPKLWFTAKVSSGTYIRSLAEDIGQALGTGAYLSALRRLSVDKFNVDDSQALTNLNKHVNLLTI